MHKLITLKWTWCWRIFEGDYTAPYFSEEVTSEEENLFIVIAPRRPLVKSIVLNEIWSVFSELSHWSTSNWSCVILSDFCILLPDGLNLHEFKNEDHQDDLDLNCLLPVSSWIILAIPIFDKFLQTFVENYMLKFIIVGVVMLVMSNKFQCFWYNYNWDSW